MLETSEQIASVVATRKMKSIVKSNISDSTTITNSYNANNTIIKKNIKKRQRLEEQAEIQAQMKQSKYSPDELLKMDNSCIVLFTQYEKMLLERIVGNKRCNHMLSSGKMTFMFK